VLVAAVVGFLVRLVVGIALAVLLALLLAVLRDDGSFSESFRVSVWAVGALMLLMAGVGDFSDSPGVRTARREAVVPWFPKLAPYMSQESTTRVSPTALFILTALTLFAIGLALG
jgi:hypothetical protein